MKNECIHCGKVTPLTCNECNKVIQHLQEDNDSLRKVNAKLKLIINETERVKDNIGRHIDTVMRVSSTD